MKKGYRSDDELIYQSSSGTPHAYPLVNRLLAHRGLGAAHHLRGLLAVGQLLGLQEIQWGFHDVLS